ncbi:MAG: hypothetical protein ACYC33_05455 [Thermoleophilia bacterium]
MSLSVSNQHGLGNRNVRPLPGLLDGCEKECVLDGPGKSQKQEVFDARAEGNTAFTMPQTFSRRAGEFLELELEIADSPAAARHDLLAKSF